MTEVQNGTALASLADMLITNRRKARRTYRTITQLRALCRDAGAHNVGALNDLQVLHYARLVTGLNIIAIAADGRHIES